ncbi:uncharacterized protein LOC121864809 isoform X2 [Homarus americanus]|uniref:uncharacterized protein LOC121864809 isoform X2 n=1 Tax=Homarus americanus TaxID=6706 RepID=UPI001C466960|nr:uncharacterized protein LOC121864809 isoform X2 [Homarus americanus]
MAEGVAGGGGGEPVAHRTRGALEEIPRPATITLRHTQLGNLDNGPTWSATINLPSSYLSPTPSPDELVIRGRGRRSLPLEWSPIPIESPIKRTEKTPIKRSPGKGMIVLRSSPRKRLQLNDTPPRDLLDHRRMMQMSPIMKKCRSLTVSPVQSPPEVAIKGLSQNQLVDVLNHVLTQHPELKGRRVEDHQEMEGWSAGHTRDEISDILPQPDLKQMEEKLNQQKKCIFKALPVSRLASKTDSPAYNKAGPHLINFKKTINEQCGQLVEAEQWVSLVDYTLLAWSYVRATPLWDSHHHNNCRRLCFKTLAQHCLQGLTKLQWTQDQLENLLKKLEQCSSDHEEMDQCIQHVQTVLSNQQ